MIFPGENAVLRRNANTSIVRRGSDTGVMRRNSNTSIVRRRSDTGVMRRNSAISIVRQGLATSLMLSQLLTATTALAQVQTTSQSAVKKPGQSSTANGGARRDVSPVQDKLNQAKQDLDEALKKFGENSLEVALAVKMYALQLKNAGQFDESISYALTAKRLLETLPNSSPELVSDALDLLGRDYRHKGLLIEAEVYQRQALAKRKMSAEKDPHGYSMTLEDLGKVLGELNRHSEALNYYREAVQVLERAGVKRGLSVARGNLAGEMIQTGKSTEAIALLKTTLADMEKDQDTDPVYHADIIILIAQAYSRAGNQDEALQYFQKAQQEILSVYGKWTFASEAVARGIAGCRIKQGRFVEALKLFNEIDLHRNENKHSDDWFLANATFQSKSLLEHLGVDTKFGAQQSSARASEFSHALSDYINNEQSLSAQETLEKIYNEGAARPTFYSLVSGMLLIKRVEHLDGGSTREDILKSCSDGLKAQAQKACAQPLTGANSASPELAETREIYFHALMLAASLEGYAKNKDNSESALDVALNCLNPREANSSQNASKILTVASTFRKLGNYNRARRLVTPLISSSTKDISSSTKDTSISAKDVSSSTKDTSISAKDVSSSTKDDRTTFAALQELTALDLAEADMVPALSNASKALSLAKNLFGPDSQVLIQCYRNLAEIELRSGDFDAANRYCDLGLKCHGIGEGDTIFFNSLIGYSQICEGQYKEADATIEKALANCNDDRFRTIDIRTQFAAASAAQSEARIKLGDLKGALLDLGYAYSSDTREFGTEALLACARDCSGISRVHYLQGDKQAAAEYALRAASYIDKFINSGMSQLSFAQQCAFVGVTRQVRDLLLSTCVSGADLSAAYTYSMKWKGLLLETLREQSMLSKAASSDSPLIQKTARDLAAVRAKLSMLSNSQKKAEENNLFNQLSSQKEELERQLVDASKSTKVKDAFTEKNADSFRALLSKDQAFLDILTFTSMTDDREHYALIAMKAGTEGNPKFFDLGVKQDIDKTVANWRAICGQQRGQLQHFDNVLAKRDIESDEVATTAGSEANNYAELNQKLLSLFMSRADVLQYLGNGISRLWLCPEAELAGIPWNSLAIDNGANKFSICEVDSPRQLAQLASNPRQVAGDNHILLTGISDFADNKFQNLPGTRKEIDSIKIVADDAKVSTDVLLDKNATKQNVFDKIQKASIAHFSTHGFAKAAKAKDSNQLGKVQFGIMLFDPSIVRNPLTESGIVLASTAGTTSGASLFTGEEIVGLDLSGCNLFSLSACKTGLGTGLNGQGVIGLRSAVMAAGARSILMSLWSVDDDATQALMQKFYEKLLNKNNPVTEADALRQAQEYIKTQPQWSAPVYWAGWVIAGDGWQTN